LKLFHPSWKTLVVSGVAVACVGALVVVLVGTGTVHSNRLTIAPTKGTIPSSNNRTIDTKKVPDYISVLGRDGKIAGYTPRAYLLPGQVNQPVNSKVGGVAPVYASNLKTLVGHFYPGVGFVALGRSLASQPCTPITTYGETAEGQTVTTATIACPSTIETVRTSSGPIRRLQWAS
jgi:hypothetical protein